MYRIFISHSWKYSNQYDKIVEFLNNGGISYYNHSVPKDDPVHTNGTDKQLQDAIDAKIKGCSCVIILAGVYSSCVLEEGPYKGQKCTYHFFAPNKATHCFTQEELVERVCSGAEEKAFKQKVKEAPEIKIDDKGRVIH